MNSRDQRRHDQAEQGVPPPNMGERIRVRQVRAIPRRKKIATKALLSIREGAAIEFIRYWDTRYPFAIDACPGPPLTGPITACHHFRFIANPVVEAWDGGLNVDPGFDQ